MKVSSPSTFAEDQSVVVYVCCEKYNIQKYRYTVYIVFIYKGFTKSNVSYLIPWKRKVEGVQ